MRLTACDEERAGCAACAEPDPGVEEDLASSSSLRVWTAGLPAGGARARVPRALRARSVCRTDASPYTRGRRRAARHAARRASQAGRERLEQPRGGTTAQAERVGGRTTTSSTTTTTSSSLARSTTRSGGSPTAGAYASPGRRRRAAGLWGNHAYEAADVVICVDDEGEPLHRRALATRCRFEQPPPVDAFWSVTMYDVPEFFLVANPIDRYSIGDRTPGLRRDDDGALTARAPARRPRRRRGAPTGCPTRAGAFRPLLRMYAPRPEVFDGSLRAAANRPRARLRRAAARRAAASTPSTRTTLSRAFAPRTTLTRDGATPARAAIRRHSASLARPSTGGAVTRAA